MKILVTGGTGFIGSHTSIELVNDGHNVVIVDNLCNSNIDTLDRIRKITGIKVKFYDVDLTNYKDLESVFIENKFDAVIHLAGVKAVNESVQRPLKYFMNNLNGTVNLLTIMEKYSVKRLVFSSSATVYGKMNDLPLKEDSTLDVTNPYGRTKLMIEEMLEDIFNSSPNWGIASLRYFNPIGAHSSGLNGEIPRGIPNNIMPYITQVAVGKLDMLSVYGNDYPTHDGSGIRDYIHVEDLAKGHILALEKVLKNNLYEVYNLGTGKGYSVFELISMFEKTTGIEIPYKIVDRRDGDVAACYADSTKAFKDLGWKAEKNLRDMCIDAWKWQNNIG
ncbi:UDP-glucose 4-epimerase GalE [Ornithinibacillus gellani]|uniref:UDP-glucose 4-epimerase GalE n=1 Tax=Ornithinibacillus gellani TaxID=2293253 RepID=UPI000F47E0AD|nr:UDP-glucose 4-epimerase GalE [Ornithinibacillus gellani]TQS71168.1 UDP-glucose 4-epimerase GalE [Ornithinibacillus gellani]